MTDIDLDDVRARANAAFKEIDRLCAGGRWTMTVPVKDTDSDLVISDALESLLDLVDTLADRLDLLGKRLKVQKEISRQNFEE